MKKKFLKIAALSTAILLIFAVIFFANAFVGNPISKWAATNTAKEYLADTYSGRDFEVERVAYDFKSGNYYAYVTSPTSIDSHFSLGIDMWGNLQSDYYADRVTNGLNTAGRINEQYGARVDSVLDNQAFPYTAQIGFGDIAFIEREYADNDDVPPYAIVTEELVLDAFYDIDELGAKAGIITIYLEDEVVSYERAAQILLDIRKIFDSAGVKFYAVNFVLEYPQIEDGTKQDDRIEVIDFLYTNIYEIELIGRVQAADEAAAAYYAEQDALKFQ